jgi:hypothetical protein
VRLKQGLTEGAAVALALTETQQSLAWGRCIESIGAPLTNGLVVAVVNPREAVRRGALELRK